MRSEFIHRDFLAGDDPDESDSEPGALERPHTRGDCQDGCRPCPWVTCRYHLLTDVSPAGSLVLNLSGPGERGARTVPARADERQEARWADKAVRRLQSMGPTCSLDVADQSAHTLRQVGQLLGVTRERVRQIEAKAIARARRKGGQGP